MNRLALFLLGVGAGLIGVASLKQSRQHPAIKQALYERSQIRYLN